MPRRSVLVLLTLLVAAAAAIVLRLFVGGVPTSEAGGSLFPTLMKIRGDRAVAGAVVGAALAVSGVMLQVLLRNPIASPDLLGVASGAGLGVMVELSDARGLRGLIDRLAACRQAGRGGQVHRAL